MPAKQKTLRVCENGHRYYKSSDCPTCPTCEIENKQTGSFLALLAAPARRALVNNKITTLEHLSAFSEKEILKFHGMGPSSLPILKSALFAAGLNFKN